MTSIQIRERMTPRGLVVEARGSDAGRAFRHVELVPVQGAEVGFGRRIGQGLRKLGRSKALRGLARVATRVVQATPYGAAATSALNVARAARDALRGGGRRGSSSSARRAPSSPRGRRPRGSSRRAPLSLSDRQRIELARRLLEARYPSRERWQLMRDVLGVQAS